MMKTEMLIQRENIRIVYYEEASKITEHDELDIYLDNLKKTLVRCGVSDNDYMDFVQLKLMGKH